MAVSRHINRRAVRRAASTSCQAVGMRGFRLLGERVVDLSPRGMLVTCDVGAELGEQVMVSFLAPGSRGRWLDAEATVARIIQGYRPHDPGYCIGLEFDYFERSARNELLTRLAGVPPPVPRRRLRRARDRAADYGPVAVAGIVRVAGHVPNGVWASR